MWNWVVRTLSSVWFRVVLCSSVCGSMWFCSPLSCRCPSLISGALNDFLLCDSKTMSQQFFLHSANETTVLTLTAGVSERKHLVVLELTEDVTLFSASLPLPPNHSWTSPPLRLLILFIYLSFDELWFITFTFSVILSANILRTHLHPWNKTIVPHLHPNLLICVHFVSFSSLIVT